MRSRTTARRVLASSSARPPIRRSALACATSADRRFGVSVYLASLLEYGFCDLDAHGAFDEIGSDAQSGECLEDRSIVGCSAEEQVLGADVVVAVPQCSSRRLLEPFPVFSRVGQPSIFRSDELDTRSILSSSVIGSQSLSQSVPRTTWRS
jgi:hypothetical protein